MTHTTQVLSDEQMEQLAHRTCSRYKHNTQPSYVEYVFQPHTLGDFARAIESATLKAVSGQEPVPFNGWYCAHCKCAVDPIDVTYHEQHTACGRVITHDAPPAQPAPAMTPSAVELLAEKYANHDFCSDYLSTITSIVREVEARAALQCAQAPQPTKGQP